ncbi:hypothetical protein [Oceanobacillus picturae]|uniref:hypothetical protein n=1 Tax=Oceanobacillus picturae TaxID=171693 RepID=UPI000E69E4CD|nr:hypothetical protein [Oceanobacillus picturae]RIU93302.1 hypothetical protein D1864_07465 [Oceanobacillus picturae]
MNNTRENRRGKTVNKNNIKPAKHHMLYITVQDADTSQTVNIKRYFGNQEEKEKYFHDITRGVCKHVEKVEE